MDEMTSSISLFDASYLDLIERLDFLIDIMSRLYSVIILVLAVMFLKFVLWDIFFKSA